MMRRWLNIVVTAIVVAWALPGCNGDELPNNVIVSNEHFTLTGDSLTLGDTVIYSHNGFTIESNIPAPNGTTKQLKLPHNDKHTAGVHTSHHLVDALSALSASILSDNAHMQFASSNDMYDAISLALAYHNPTLSMKLLRQQVVDGRVVGEDTDFYPAHNDRLAWVTAAWRVYLATGDRNWLRWAYRIADATLRHDSDIVFDDRTGMVHGSSSDYTHLTQSLPAWMDNNEVFATYTLNNNIETVGALTDMARMADELGIDGSDLETQARRCMEALNAHMWNESHGQYTAMLYGLACNLHAPCSDNRAQALAVMWGLADNDDRATTLIEKTPVTHCGINTFYPTTTPTSNPSLDEQSWGLVQGLWNMAAARVDNDNALRRGLAALWRAQLLYSTPMTEEGNRSLDMACAVSNVAMTHRLMAGLNFEPQGIEFAPIVPQCLPGDKKLLGFAYRSGTLDITVRGTGHDVDHVQLDGKRIDGTFVRASQLQGHHTIEITMREGIRGKQGVTIASGRNVRPEHPVVMWNGDSVAIVNYNPHLAYRLVVDGARHYSINDSTFQLPQIDKFAEMTVIASNKRCFGYASKPFVVGGTGYYYAPIPRGMAGSDRVSVEVKVRRAGTYMLNVNYISPATSMDVRTVSANTHRMGIVVMGGLGTDSVASQSNLIAVDLLTGKNTIDITAHPSSRATATPLSINLFKKE